MRAEYIPDDKQDIITTVLRLKERVGENGVIFSSGGIGGSQSMAHKILVSMSNLAIEKGCFSIRQRCSSERMEEHLEWQCLSRFLEKINDSASASPYTTQLFAGPTHDDITYGSLASAFGKQ